MFYLFKTPPLNSPSSSHELVAESHSQERVEDLYRAYLNVGLYNLLLLTEATPPCRAQDDNEEEQVVRGFRPDTPLESDAIEPDAPRSRKAKKEKKT